MFTKQNTKQKVYYKTKVYIKVMFIKQVMYTKQNTKQKVYEHVMFTKQNTKQKVDKTKQKFQNTLCLPKKYKTKVNKHVMFTKENKCLQTRYVY